MNSYTNLSIRVATVLAGGVAAFGGLLAATPAHAYYGAMPVYNDATQVCAGRFDPNCMTKEVAYLNSTSYNYNYYYQTPQQNVYYPQPVPAYNYNTYTPNYSYNDYIAPVYNYNTPSYNYQYQYSYQYQTPSYSYDYSY